MKVFSAFTVAAMLAISTTAHDDHEDFGWEILDVKMPRAISDHTASIGEDGLVYIAGGCDSPNGNEYFTDFGGYFACTSLSNQLYSFDPVTRQFQTLESMPHFRYRHSSAIVNNQLWIVGGRDIDDTLIADIDIYDIDSKSWSSVTLPAQYVVSDHASFAQEPSYVYIVGGYNQNYTALDQAVRIDITTVGDATLSVETLDSLNTPRGDITGVITTDGDSAFITGGFTHENNFCEPLGSTEEYVFDANLWNMRPDLVKERGEIVLVELLDHLYALGGERQIEGQCEGAGDGLDPGEKTVGTDEVEVYDSTTNSWDSISGFPDHRFRFAAVAAQDGLIYTFGGQTAHDTSCQCFKTTDTVAIFGDDVGSGASLSVWPLVSMVIGTVSMALIM